LLERVTPAAASVAAHAPAKINLALHVTGRRSDGYHLLETLAVFTRFGDWLTVRQAENDAFAVTGPFAGALCADSSNLVLKARDALRRRYPGQAEAPVSITLEKNLPVASGIGGGSSDAAAALRELARFWRIKLHEEDLARMGLELGADVPMCLAAKPLIACGVGEVLSLLPDLPELPMVLVNPGVGVSTAHVFGALERCDGPGLPPLPDVIEFHSLRDWLGRTRNDLEPAARLLQSAVETVLAALDRAGSGFSRMSGSGATCFGLFETGNMAKRAAVAIRRRHPDWFVAATRSMPSGDVAR
jgi:4-diphosphocytidyl-2-C-methyl-D-erythritol kinase